MLVENMSKEERTEFDTSLMSAEDTRAKYEARDRQMAREKAARAARQAV